MERVLLCVLCVIAPGWTACDSSPDTDTFRVTLADTDGAAVFTGELDVTITIAGPVTSGTFEALRE